MSSAIDEAVNCGYYWLQCIGQLKTERQQLLDQLEAVEEQLDQCKMRCVELTTDLSSLHSVREQLRAKTADCDRLTACNVGYAVFNTEVYISESQQRSNLALFSGICKNRQKNRIFDSL